MQLLTYALYIIPIYVFMQRVHNQTQQRALKSISDEVIKVNDFIIEFIYKFEALKESTEIDEKSVYELRMLKSKINAHLNYITDYLVAFPYGGPLNFAYYFFFKQYLSDTAEKKALDLELGYQDLVISETILSLEIEFIVNNRIVINYEDLKELNQESIDRIINKGSRLQHHLEENTRKMF